VQHQYPIRTVVVAQPMGIVANALLTHAWIVGQLQGLKRTALMILRANPAQKHRTGWRPFQPSLQRHPGIKRLGMDHHLHTGGKISIAKGGTLHLSHR
jgi:hypothetical protein